MNEPLEVHVLGGKKGESIILRLPGDNWGVVDNYTPSLKHPEKNPSARFLRGRGVRHLRFLCLTHPHDDHYRGMSQVLEDFAPDQVWLFGAASPRYLYEKLAPLVKSTIEAEPVDTGDAENVDELVRLFDRIQADFTDRQRIPPLEVKRLHLKMPLLQLDCAPPLRITSIGASAGQCLLYEQSLMDCFNAKEGVLADEQPSIDHNMISGGLLIEYGEARVVLGGDIDAAAWEETMRTLTPERLSSELVKISHHGSSTGYCGGLWERLSPGKKTVAVLTPFSSQGLPSPEGLEHIISKAKRVYSASIGGARLAANWDDYALDGLFAAESADILLTLRSVFSRTPPSSERLEGICSFLVHSDGTVDYSGHGDAGSLTTPTS